MEESRSGMTWLGVLFFVVILLVLLGGGLGGCGNGLWGNRGNCVPEGGCSRVSNCEVEKREIIDSARTQYLTEQQGEETRTAIRDSRDAVMGQASRIYEAQQAEKIFDLKMENMSLKNNFYTKELVGGLSQQLSDCCCAFNRRLDAIECDMLKQPRLSGVAATCNGQLVPAIFRDDCGNCGRNRNI